jgi:hypothetical protein
VEQAAASDEEAAPTVTPKKQNTQWLNEAEQQGQAPLLKIWRIRKRSATFCALNGRQSFLNLRMILQRELRPPKLPGTGVLPWDIIMYSTVLD